MEFRLWGRRLSPRDRPQSTREGLFREGLHPFARSWTAAVLCRFPVRWQVQKRQMTAALVRLRVSVHRRVRVPPWRSFPPETESNCVVATRGGEQLEVNG